MTENARRARPARSVSVPIALIAAVVSALVGGGGGASLYNAARSHAAPAAVSADQVGALTDRVTRSEGEIKTLANKIEQLQLAGAGLTARLDGIVSTLGEIKSDLKALTGPVRRR